MYASVMSSAVPPPAVDLLAVLDAAADRLAAVEGDIAVLDSLDEARSAVERVRSLCSRLAAIEARVVGHVDRVGLFVTDGHRTDVCWHTHITHVTRGESLAVVATARMMRTCDQIAKALATGELGVAQARCLARLHRNPRAGHKLADHQGPLLDAAAVLPIDDFTKVCTQWEQWADEDGTLADLERAHRRRDASLTQRPDGTWKLQGDLTPLPGKAMADIWDQYVDAQRLAEADDPDLAMRTPAQRRADALFDLFQNAAATPADSQRPEPLCNLVVGYERVEAWMSGTPDPGGVCETIDGTPVHPADALAAVLVGRLRRVVFDTSGVVIDLGRTSRLFRGGARDAAIIQGHARCTWLTCGRTGTSVQVDHTTDWQHGGTTSPDNNDLLCGYHNRLKQKGFRLWRDPTGIWHFYRPDGTEIT